MIFTGRLKRSNEGPFCSQNGFNSDFDNSTWLKSVFLETRPSPFMQKDHLKPTLSL